MDDLQLDPAAPQGDGQVPEQQPQDNFNPQEWGYQFRHETVFPKSREEMTELLQLGHSYKQNKSTWDAERQQWTQAKPKYQQYEQFEQALQKNPQFAQELRGLAERYQQQNQGQDDPRYSELAQQVERMQQFQADYELTQEMNNLKAKHHRVKKIEHKLRTAQLTHAERRQLKRELESIKREIAQEVELRTTEEK